MEREVRSIYGISRALHQPYTKSLLYPVYTHHALYQG